MFCTTRRVSGPSGARKIVLAMFWSQLLHKSRLYTTVTAAVFGPRYMSSLTLILASDLQLFLEKFMFHNWPHVLGWVSCDVHQMIQISWPVLITSVINKQNQANFTQHKMYCVLMIVSHVLWLDLHYLSCTGAFL